MKAVLESASLIDALNAAVRIAPESGEHFEQCQGLLLECAGDKMMLSATDGAVTWQRTFDHVSVEGRPAWRIASIVAKFMAKLPIANDATVTIEDIEYDRIRVASGTMRGEFATLSAYTYPRISVEPDTEHMATVHGLADALKRVTFALGKETGSVLSGVHLDGAHMIACNKHMAAQTPCAMPVEHPITAPLAPLTGTLKRADEIQLGSIGQRMVLMPDPDTVITSTIIEAPYPDTVRLWAMTEPCTQWVEFDASEALSVLTRILVLCKEDAYPTCEVTFTEGALVFDIQVPDLGRVTDEAPCSGSIDGPFTMKFSPRDLQPALAAGGGTVQLHYQKNPLKPIRIDGHEWSCVMMPKAK